MQARRAAWDLSALLVSADPKAPLPEQHLWLVRLAQWLRQPAPVAEADAAEGGTPWPVRRLRHLLQLLQRHPAQAESVVGVLRTALSGTQLSTLLAEHGFAPRLGFGSEVLDRLRLSLVPATPDTQSLGELFALVLHDADDAQWIAAIDAPLLEGWAALVLTPALRQHWREAAVESIDLLAAQVRATGLAPQLRLRMDAVLLAERPFHGLAHAAQRLGDHMAQGDDTALLQEVQVLRGLLARCLAAADSVHPHLEAYGVSVDVVFQTGQIRARCERIEALCTSLVSPAAVQDWRWLVAELARAGHERRSWRQLFGRQYSLLARKVTERNAETGEHYITRTRAEWRQMLGRALGGGAVIGITTLVKFGIVALGFSAFWGGFWAGVNYATSFVAIHLAHWTVATKQPAMTAPAMAAKLQGVDRDDAAVEAFVDEVAHLMRSQIAGIAGNLLAVVPVVLVLQGLSWWGFGQPLVGEHAAQHALDTLSLLGPTPVYAAFTGVLLFAASLIAGWVENSFVWHRLDSAIAWNPKFVAVLGDARAKRWAAWWRANISGLTANVSLGLMLGLVPTLAAFFGLPIEVRHVTLSTGQLAAALGAFGPALLHEPLFWWGVAAIPFTGALNLLVSFALAFRVALRSRGVPVRDRGRLYAALRRRLRQAPLGFLWPPRRS